MTKFCALCQTSLTAANSTKDHVIPNAIGGRKKVRNFICRSCNSKTGEKWDSELAKQLQPFSTMLDVRRERRENQPIAVETVSGRKLTWNPGGLLTTYKPTFDQRVENDKTLITIQARSTTDLRRILSRSEANSPRNRCGETHLTSIFARGVFTGTASHIAHIRWYTCWAFNYQIMPCTCL